MPRRVHFYPANKNPYRRTPGVEKCTRRRSNIGGLCTFRRARHPERADHPSLRSLSSLLQLDLQFQLIMNGDTERAHCRDLRLDFPGAVNGVPVHSR